MTKAQQVRWNRLEKLNKAIEAEAEKIFEWILDIMDADTENGDLVPLEVVLWYDDCKIKTKPDYKTEYDLKECLLKYDRVQLFTNLKKLIEKEEGFKADLNFDHYLWDSKAIILRVVME